MEKANYHLAFNVVKKVMLRLGKPFIARADVAFLVSELQKHIFYF